MCEDNTKIHLWKLCLRYTKPALNRVSIVAVLNIQVLLLGQCNLKKLKKSKLHGLSSRANYTD
jgi:hypothetical protein